MSLNSFVQKNVPDKPNDACRLVYSNGTCCPHMLSTCCPRWDENSSLTTLRSDNVILMLFFLEISSTCTRRPLTLCSIGEETPHAAISDTIEGEEMSYSGIQDMLQGLFFFLIKPNESRGFYFFY